MAPPESKTEPNDITRLLREIARGERRALDRLVPLVYDELRVFARRKLRFEPDGHTLSTTALVHEAYLKLVDQNRVQWQSRWHFYAVASQAMRRILVDHARRRATAKRGGAAAHVSVDEAEERGAPELFTPDQADELLALSEALDRLAEFNPRGARVVEHRFFGGLAYDEIAEVMGVSKMTVRRSWTVAKAWLREELSDEVVDSVDSLMTGTGAEPERGVR